MTNQKYQEGQNVILLEIGTRLPIVSATVIGYVPDNSTPYRIRYQFPGDIQFTIDDVKEDRLTTMSEISLQNARRK